MGIHSPARGLVRAALALFLYAFIPYAASVCLRDPQAVGIDLDLSGYNMQGVLDLLERSVWFSPIMAALGFATGFFRKGDRNRIWAQAASLIGGYVWFLYLINFGDLGGLITAENALDIEGGKADLSIGIFVTGMIGIVAALKLLRLPIYYCQYRDHREEFLGKYDPKGYDIYVLSNDSDEEYENRTETGRRRRRWASI